ncbi:hypothetical protein [Thiohalocapsa marina]|uniref:hypothetical protein n=1 Tax=Thiohalocapsa marina TaxID=424902 RepID=UPI0036DD7930
MQAIAHPQRRSPALNNTDNRASDATMTLFSIIESPDHPRLETLYQRLGLHQIKLASQRKAIQALKQTSPDWVVAEFFYGFGNNYAGANVSNLDVFLASLRKAAPEARVIVLVSKEQARYVPLLAERFPLHAVLTLPVTESEVEAILDGTRMPEPSTKGAGTGTAANDTEA